jgi:Ca2+-transporting ATPase
MHIHEAWSKSIHQVLEETKSSKKGLSSHEAQKRLNSFGPNALEKEKIHYWKIFQRQYSNFLFYVLMAVALIALILGKWPDFFVILAMILINVFIGFWQEIRAEISIRNLRKMTETQNMVLRDDQVQNLNSSHLVVGDIVYLSEGSIISADMRLIENAFLEVDEASLTGESVPVVKEAELVLKKETFVFDQKNMLFCGTMVVKGSAKAVVVKTGKNTYFATIAKSAQKESPVTPLMKALKTFSWRYTLFLVAILCLIGFVAFFQAGRQIADVAYILLAELVSAVPEGLPIVITLVLVLGALSLSKKKTLVRYLPSVETLGSATLIASDKTGTITEGNIQVSEIFALDEEALKQVALFCNDSEGDKGDPIDVALARWTPHFREERLKYERLWSHPFDTKARLMATVYTIDQDKKLFIKGAFEELKKKMTNEEHLTALEEKLHLFASKGLRVLAFGIAEFNSKKIEDWKIKIVGLIGFLDPPKESAALAVHQAKMAGVRVIMLTGDYPITAKAIAKEVGIYQEGDQILTGEQMDKMTSEEIKKTLRHTSVFARILPEHKYHLVKLLQAQNEIVAVSGDGVNDVPALKAANLGIAMGSGTEAAKSVAKMIILDNDLKVIVDAIYGGRTIAANIRKVIYYLLSTCLMELFVISFSILGNLPLPLVPIQILWINLVTDGVQDKTFPFAKGEMQYNYRNVSNSFFNKTQIGRILFFGVPMGFVCYFLFEFLMDHYSYPIAMTITFLSVVMAQWANGIQSQKEKEPFFKNIRLSFSINPYIFLAILIGFVLQLLAIYVFPHLFHAVPLSINLWKYPLIISAIAFVLVEMRKWIEFFWDRWIQKKKKIK